MQGGRVFSQWVGTLESQTHRISETPLKEKNLKSHPVNSDLMLKPPLKHIYKKMVPPLCAYLQLQGDHCLDTYYLTHLWLSTHYFPGTVQSARDATVSKTLVSVQTKHWSESDQVITSIHNCKWKVSFRKSSRIHNCFWPDLVWSEGSGKVWWRSNLWTRIQEWMLTRQRRLEEGIESQGNISERLLGS